MSGPMCVANMVKILPQRYYGDPANVYEDVKRDEERAKRSCETCKHSGELWGAVVCWIDRKPHGGGYCGQWEAE